MTISVRLPGSIAKALDQVCRATDRPRSYFILKALDRYLAEQAEYHRLLWTDSWTRMTKSFPAKK